MIFSDLIIGTGFTGLDFLFRVLRTDGDDTMSSTTSDGAVVVAMEISAWTLELGEDEMGLEKGNQYRSYYLISL